MADLSIVIVSWNVRELLRGCLASIQASPGVRLEPAGQPTAAAGDTRDQKTIAVEVVVVDNASADGSGEMVRREYSWARLITNAENRGFTAANNQGIAISGGACLLLLNPDTVLVGDALATMWGYLESHPDVAMVGPQLRCGVAASPGEAAAAAVTVDGVQSSRRRFPTLATAFVESTVLQGVFGNSAILRDYYVLDRPDDLVQDVDWVVGAAMMVRRAVVDQVGGLDESFFMYSEELDWCRRIRAASNPAGSQWRIVYLPSARVVHYEGRSSAQAPALKQIQFHASKVRYFRKYRGRLASEALRLFLLGTFAYQIVEESAKWLVGHKRALRTERVGIYWQVLRSGLRTKRT